VNKSTHFLYGLAALLILSLVFSTWLIASLHDERIENMTLHYALADKTLKHGALVKLNQHLDKRVMVTEDLLRAARDKLTLRDIQHDSDLIMVIFKGAKYYSVPVSDYAVTTVGADDE